MHSTQAEVRRRGYPLEDYWQSQKIRSFSKTAEAFPCSPMNLRTFPIFSTTNGLGCTGVHGREMYLYIVICFGLFKWKVLKNSLSPIKCKSFSVGKSSQYGDFLFHSIKPKALLAPTLSLSSRRKQTSLMPYHFRRKSSLKENRLSLENDPIPKRRWVSSPSLLIYWHDNLHQFKGISSTMSKLFES